MMSHDSLTTGICRGAPCSGGEKTAGKETSLTFMQVVATYYQSGIVHFNHYRTLKLQSENMRTFNGAPQALVKVSQLLLILRKQTWVINNRPDCLSVLRDITDAKMTKLSGVITKTLPLTAIPRRAFDIIQNMHLK